MGMKTKLHPKFGIDWSHSFRFYYKSSSTHCFLLTDLPGDSTIHCIQQQPMNLFVCCNICTPKFYSTQQLSKLPHDFPLDSSPSHRQSQSMFSLKGEDSKNHRGQRVCPQTHSRSGDEIARDRPLDTPAQQSTCRETRPGSADISMVVVSPWKQEVQSGSTSHSQLAKL